MNTKSKDVSKESTDGKAHSILGASSSHRWMHCPASVRMSQLAPPSKGSSYAMEGTVAHELAERCLEKNKNPEDYKGAQIGKFEVTEEMIEAVKVYVDLVREEAGKLEIMIEKRFDLSWLWPGMFGTNDACTLEPFGLLRIYDYKHGAGIAVDVVDNSQLIYYAIGAAYDRETKSWRDIDAIEMVIVQPRAFHRDGPIRRWRIDLDELKKWAEKLKYAAELTTWEDAPIFAGDHCGFCPAAGMCPELNRKAQVAAKSDFTKALADPRTLTKEEIARVVSATKMITGFLTACHSLALENQMGGIEMPGLKLVRKRSSRNWIDEKDTIAMLDGAGYSDSEYNKSKLMTPNQIEKLLKDNGDSKDLVKEHIFKRDGDIDIAPVSDKRKEVVVDMALEFKE